MTRTFSSLIAAVMLLAVVGCDRYSAPPTGSSSAPGSAASGPAGGTQAAPIRIGASISLTGKDERTGKELKQGYDLWAEQVNAKGGVLGRKVEFVILDDKSEPETARNLYEKLISEDKVDLIIGPYSTPVTIPASQVAEKYRYAMVVSGASGTDIFNKGYKHVFGVYTMAPFYMDGAVDLAKRNGYTTMAIVNENSAFAKDVATSTAQKAKDAGIEVVHTEEYGRDVRDLSPILTKVRATNADVLVGGTYGEDATLLVRQLKDLNWTPKMVALTIGPALPDFTQGLGDDANYIFGATQWEPSVKAQGAPEFTAAYNQKYGYLPGYHAAGGYGAAQLLQQALEKVGAVDNEKLRETLATMETQTSFGAYRVDPATGAQAAKPGFLIQILGGERKMVWPDAAAETQAVIPMPPWGSRP
jgi:branched-chain amino acid transport system substrate-binding protein